jgi:hypothetical protein
LTHYRQTKELFRSTRRILNKGGRAVVIKFLLWCVLFILCWPVALFALVLYPIVWLLLLPFRLLGIAVHGVLELVAALLFLPARLLRAV